MTHQRVKRLALQPIRVESADEDADRFASRAARYGSVRSFFLDERIYVEPAGIWTVGDETSEMVVTNDAADYVRVTVAAGPMPTRVSIAVEDDRPEEIDLSPGERRTLELATGLWRVKTAGLFRPIDHEEGNTDARPLGARLEFQ